MMRFCSPKRPISVLPSSKYTIVVCAEIRSLGAGIGVAAYATPTSATRARKPTPASTRSCLKDGTKRRTPSYFSRG